MNSNQKYKTQGLIKQPNCINLSNMLQRTKWGAGGCNNKADYEGIGYCACFKEPLQRKVSLRNRAIPFPLVLYNGEKTSFKGWGRRGGKDCSRNPYFPLLFLH